MSNKNRRVISRRWLLGGSVALGTCTATGMLSLVACTDDEEAFDYARMFQTLAETELTSGVDALGAALVALSQAVKGVVDAATLLTARERWSDAWSAYQRLSCYALGPIKERASQLAWYPIKEDNIEATIAGASAFVEGDVAALGTSSKGLLTLEYLLFPEPGASDEILVALQDGASSRSSFAVALAAALATESAALIVDQAGFAQQFSTASNGSKLFPSAKDAVDVLVNQIIFAIDVLANDHLAIPLGLKTGTVDPSLEVTRRSGATLRGLAAAFSGGGLAALLSAEVAGRSDGLALRDLIAHRSPELADEVDAAHQASALALAAIPEPLHDSIMAAPGPISAAFDALVAQKKLWLTDVVTVLGVTLTVNDNDGD